jgi:signal transduction histidine kinase
MAFLVIVTTSHTSPHFLLGCIVIKFIEILLRWTGVATNLVMVLIYGYILHSCGNTQKISMVLMRKIAALVIIFFLVNPCYSFAFTYRMLISRSYVTIYSASLNKKMLTIIALCIQVVSILFIAYTWRKSNAILSQNSKLRQIGRGFSYLLVSFAIFNVPWFMWQLDSNPKFTGHHIIYHWKYVEGIVNSIIIYNMFLKQKLKQKAAFTLPKHNICNK